MNLQQAKITLEKINRLYQSMMLDSKIDMSERELMLNYIRQFYDAFAPGQALGTAKNVVSPTPVAKTPVVKTPVVKEPTPVVEAKPTFVPPPPPPPPVIKKEIPVVESKPVAPPPPPVVKVAKPEVSKAAVAEPGPAKEKVAKEKKPSTTIASSKIRSEYEDLFEQDQARELSDRLASSPIRDLTKAMGLNERILTQNDLFGGNKEALDGALKELNNFRKFEEAIPILTELADTYKWGERKANKKARVFVKLVQRRYL